MASLSTDKKAVKSGKPIHRFVASVGVLALLGGLVAMQRAEAENYHTPLGRMLVPSKDPDGKVGQSAPAWLARIAPPGSSVVVISCAQCSAHNILPGLVPIASIRKIVVLAKSSRSGELRTLRDEFPSLRFVPVSEHVPGLNLTIAPKLYKIDARGRFDYVQDALLNNDDFFAQFN